MKASQDEQQRTLVLATGNPAKVRELNELFQGRGWRVRSLKEVAGDVDIEESGDTLEENAEIKARFAYEKTGLPALADDTGLEVDALGGRPGVRSARYAGPAADARQNRKKLLEELQAVTDPDRRSARFRTVLVYIGHAPTERYRYIGTCEGRILTEERGSGGFGYDPLFVPDGYEETFAEMDPVEKNRISHRGRALQKFLADMS
ncbi:MAG: RdgB/HAM1 family non-canonical purine NTP pyrophosphatase [Bacteroidota bacterium]